MPSLLLYALGSTDSVTVVSATVVSATTPATVRAS